jgi:hypothetical protein
MRVKEILILFIFLIIISFGFQCGKDRNAPDHLIGVWGTSDPGYADRQFEIARYEIIFQTGKKTFDTYSIESIEMEKVPGGQRLLYTINYKSAEKLKYKFSFYYDPAENGAIRFKNQDQFVWTKEKK